VTEEERERRRVQAQMEKAEAEEAVKSRIRRAVSTRFQGRMQGPDGGGTPWATSGRAAAAQVRAARWGGRLQEQAADAMQAAGVDVSR
jgi:hypothetical protein